MHNRTRALCGALAAAALLLQAAPALALEGVVNINTATQEQLELLPGIGEAKARAILAERRERGGFDAVEALLEVKGIGDAALQRIRPHVVLQGKSTALLE